MSAERPQPKPPSKDPMTSFRAVMAGSLIMEAVAVALALPVVANLGRGLGSVAAWVVIVLAVAFTVLCGLIRRPWAVPAVLVLQVTLIAFVVTVPAVAVLGVVFLTFWIWILWLRRDVARRMAEGSLPSQQEPSV